MKASIPNLTSMTSMPGLASMPSMPGLASMPKKGLSDLLDFSLIRFGLSNPGNILCNYRSSLSFYDITISSTYTQLFIIHNKH